MYVLILNVLCGVDLFKFIDAYKQTCIYENGLEYNGSLLFFFLKDPAPPEFSPFPHPAPLPISATPSLYVGRGRYGMPGGRTKLRRGISAGSRPSRRAPMSMRRSITNTASGRPAARYAA